MSPKASSPYFKPRAWTSGEVEEDCARSAAQFVKNWASAADARRADFEQHRGDAAAELEALFDATDNLRDLRPAAFAENPGLLNPLRFVAGPFVSADDMETLSGSSGKKLELQNAARVIDVVLAALDRTRFPWVLEKRPPTEAELQSALVATSSIWATERFRTKRRNEASSQQEAAVASCLAGAGYTYSPKLPAEKLEPGQFLRARPLAGERCDVVAKLFDHRWLAIECKVSNTAVNSFKRLNHDAVAKARVWHKEYGETHMVVCAVLDGIFKPANVLDAQNNHRVFVVWAHDLSVLDDFVRRARHRD